jgi:hypothetical protein
MATPTIPLSAYDYYSKVATPTKEEQQTRRRFTEEKQEEKLPENLLGYQVIHFFPDHRHLQADLC